MNRKKIEFEQRVEQNSKNYFPKDLFDLEAAGAFFAQLKESFGLETLMTDRHGGIIMTYGDFGDFKPDVVNKPGNKIRVKGRTVCHIYAKYENVPEEKAGAAKSFLDAYIKTLEGFSGKSYMASEQSIYIEELEQQVEKDAYQAKHSDNMDPLTGALSRNSMISYMKKLDEAEAVPVAIICANINDWKFFDENFGEEESDRLITVIVDIIKKAAEKSGINDAVIGRMEGDVFNIILPAAEMEEAERYCNTIREDCLNFEDDILVPSVALGCVMKTNVEEKIRELLSDAEYAMLENKYEIKNSAGYRERIEKGLKK